MKKYSGYQYLLIDAANAYGKDKDLFEARIKWAEDNLADLENLYDTADSQPLFASAVLAIRKAQKGLPSGHLVGLDATCSGIQVMSALTGCIAGADATGLIDPNRRADAYTTCTNNMATILGSVNAVNRADAKRAVMHSFYGSKLTPIRLFGENTFELKAFYEAAEAMAPGPWELLQDLLASWNPYALSHEWKLPDGFDAKVKVMAKREVRIEVDELEHATFTYEFYENVGSERGLSNAANMVHSMDAWILRSMHRRLNYNPVVIREVSKHLAQEFDDRLTGSQQEEHTKDDEFAYYVEQYNRSTLVDATILPYINAANVSCLSDDHLNKLLSMVDGMVQHKPFELVTVHDEFKAHPNNLNQLRWMYREIMAEIADSNVLDDLLSQIYQAPGHFNKLSTNLGQLIRGSAYALC